MKIDGTVLLTRDEFREGVWARDGHRCVVPQCGSPVQDAHHILERRLWTDGGYYLDNGASVCAGHHLDAESTVLSAQLLREYAGIDHVLLPPHLYDDQPYDKWGNPVLPNGQRLRGELFTDESVQKILAPVLHLFTDHVKYPRTYHLPWSPSVSSDDRVMTTLARFEGRRVVVTAKMDGENTTMYKDYLHARSLEFQPHPSRDRVKQLHGRIGYELPAQWRLCGENLFAKHSIWYHHLPDFFLMFSLWNDKNVCLAWDDTVEWAALLGLRTVPVLFDGTWNADVIKELYKPSLSGDECEGYVVRVADEFHYKEFRHAVGKFVRANHVAVHGGHWVNRVVVENEWREP